MKTWTALFALAVLAAPGAAAAHAHLRTASPAPDAKDVPAPARLSLTFSEPLAVAFSGAELLDAAGRPVRLGRAVLADGGRTLGVPVAGPVAAGAYTVRWRVVSADTHRVAGEYHFTVKP